MTVQLTAAPLLAIAERRALPPSVDRRQGQHVEDPFFVSFGRFI